MVSKNIPRFAFFFAGLLRDLLCMVVHFAAKLATSVPVKVNKNSTLIFTGLTHNAEVGGSSPPTATKFSPRFYLTNRDVFLEGCCG